jgi:hypothetical protein
MAAQKLHEFCEPVKGKIFALKRIKYTRKTKKN